MITILTKIEHCTAVAQCIMAVASHSEQWKSPRKHFKSVA